MSDEIRKHSIYFNKELFDFFEIDKKMNINKKQYKPDQEEDLNERIFKMFLFFLLSFIIYILFFMLIQLLKSVFFLDSDTSLDLAGVISQYNNFNDSLNYSNSNEILRTRFLEAMKHPSDDFGCLKRKFEIFDFLGILIK